MFKRMGLLAALMVLGGLAYGHVHAADATVVQASEKEFQISLSTTTVPAGTPVTFQVKNDGKIQHEFVIEKAGAVDEAMNAEVEGQEVESEIEAFNPGETKSITWTFNQPGDFQVACHLPGHFEAGMVAQFKVVAAPADTNSSNSASASSSQNASARASSSSTTGAPNSSTTATGRNSPATAPTTGGPSGALDLILIASVAGLMIVFGFAVYRFARH